MRLKNISGSRPTLPPSLPPSSLSPIKGGKTKHAIENATRVRIVVADSKVHILGAFANIQVARDAVCSLILGSPPGKVYNAMRNVASRMSQRA